MCVNIDRHVSGNRGARAVGAVGRRLGKYTARMAEDKFGVRPISTAMRTMAVAQVFMWHAQIDVGMRIMHRYCHAATGPHAPCRATRALGVHLALALRNRTHHGSVAEARSQTPPLA